MTVPFLTPYPDPAPQRTDAAAVFIERADSKVAHDVTFIEEMNDSVIPAINAGIEAATDVSGAAVAAVENTDYAASSTSSLALSTGSKSVVLTQSGKLFAANDFIVAVYRPDPAIRLFMTVDSVAGTTLTCTVPSGGVFGTGGPYSNWLIIHTGFLGNAATAAEVRAGTDDTLQITPENLVEAALPWAALTDAATIAWDMALYWNTAVILGGNRTMGVPTNPKGGMTYVLEVLQDATGSRTLSWPSNYDFGAAGAPVLSTGANKRDIVSLYCYNAATPSFRCSVNYAA
jgi:hypothetical protein